MKTNNSQVEVKFKFDPDGLSGGGEYGGYFGGLTRTQEVLKIVELYTLTTMKLPILDSFQM